MGEATCMLSTSHFFFFNSKLWLPYPIKLIVNFIKAFPTFPFSLYKRFHMMINLVIEINNVLVIPFTMISHVIIYIDLL